MLSWLEHRLLVSVRTTVTESGVVGSVTVAEASLKETGHVASGAACVALSVTLVVPASQVTPTMLVLETAVESGSKQENGRQHAHGRQPKRQRCEFKLMHRMQETAAVVRGWPADNADNRAAPTLIQGRLLEICPDETQLLPDPTQSQCSYAHRSRRRV